MSKKGNDDRGANPKMLVVCLVLVAIVLMVGALYINYWYKIAFTQLLLSFVTVVTGSLITAAISILSFKYSGIIKFVKEQAENVLMREEYIENLSVDRLKRLKSKINSKLYNEEVASDNDSLLNYTLESLEPLLGEYYFDADEIEIQLKLNGDKKVIEKTIKKHLSVKPMEKNAASKISLAEILSGSIGEKEQNGSSAIEIESFVLNGEKKQATIEFRDNEVKSGLYKIKYSLVSDELDDNAILIDKKGVDIELKFITRVSINDVAIFNKVAVPCKNFSMRINYDKNEIDIKRSNFIFANDQGAIEDEDTYLRIRHQKWILPGNGIAICLEIKEK